MANRGMTLLKWCSCNAYGSVIQKEFLGYDENNNSISIDKISYCSHEKVAWRCENNHTWFAQVNRRTINNTGCTYCAGKKVIVGKK